MVRVAPFFLTHGVVHPSRHLHSALAVLPSAELLRVYRPPHVWAGLFTFKTAPSHGNLDPNRIRGSWAHPSPHLKGISIGSAIFAGITVMTERPRYSICSNRLQLASAAMQPNNNKCKISGIYVETHRPHLFKLFINITLPLNNSI